MWGWTRTTTRATPTSCAPTCSTTSTWTPPTPISRTAWPPTRREECARYDKVIRDLGGIDLQLLGLGVNGHIGFNEPADAFSTGTHQVTLTESTRDANKRFFASIDEVPTHARTMGTREILQARRVLMVASGANKAQAIKDAFFGPVTPQVPASILQYHPDFTLVADEAALSLL